MELHHQMPCWYYEKEELLRTPSFLDGVPNDVEDRYRSEGARFIFDMGTKLRLRYDTCATAIVFFHRFYMFHSFKAFPRYVTAACCLMLAGKVEETPKKCRDIIGTARSLLPDHLMEQFGTDPREEVMMYERVLLKTIKFDLQVSHPYKYLLQFTKRIKGDPERIKQLLQMAWSFINDSLATTLCLQWEPEIVACAVLYLATRMKKCTIEDWEGRQPGQRWWECFVENMSTEVMEDICHKILDLYPASEGPGPRRTDQSDSGARREPTATSGPDQQQQTTHQHSLKRSRPTGGRELGVEASHSKSHAPVSSNSSSHRATDNRTEVPLGRDSNQPPQWTANPIAPSGSANDLPPPPPPPPPPPLPDSRFPPHSQNPFHGEQQNSPGRLPPPPPPPLAAGAPTLFPSAPNLLQYNHPLPPPPTHHQSAIPQSLPVRPAIAPDPVILPGTFPTAFGPAVAAPLPPSTWFPGQPGLPVVQSAPALQALASNNFAVGGQQQPVFDVVNTGGSFVRPIL